jgi:hypothetical protein
MGEHMKTCKNYLDEIELIAKIKWGDQWKTEVLRSYVEVMNRINEKQTTMHKRQPMLDRAFAIGSCHPNTLLGLCAAVGCEMRLETIPNKTPKTNCN